MIGSTNPLVPNGTFIVELLLFLIILFLLGRYVVPRVNAAMEERQANIRKALEEAEQGRALSRQAKEEYQATLDEARKQSRGILDQARRLGEQIREEMKTKAQAEHDAMLARAQVEIERATRRARDQLREQMADLMVEATRKVLARDLPSDIQRALIEEAVATVETGA